MNCPISVKLSLIILTPSPIAISYYLFLSISINFSILIPQVPISFASLDFYLNMCGHSFGQ